MSSVIIRAALVLHRYKLAGKPPVLFLGSDLWPVTLPSLAERYLRRTGALSGDREHQRTLEVSVTDTTAVVVRWQGLSENERIGEWLEVFDRRWSESSRDEQFTFLDEQFRSAGRPESVQAVSEWIAEGYFDLIFTTDVSSGLEDALADRGLRRRDVLYLPLDSYSADQIRFAAGASVHVPRIKIIKLNGDLYTWNFWISPRELHRRKDQQKALIRDMASLAIISLGHSALFDVDLNQVAKENGCDFISASAGDVASLHQWLQTFQKLPEQARPAFFQLPPDVLMAVLQAHGPGDVESLAQAMEAELAQERLLVQLTDVVEILDEDQTAGKSNGEETISPSS